MPLSPHFLAFSLFSSSLEKMSVFARHAGRRLLFHHRQSFPSAPASSRGMHFSVRSGDASPLFFFARQSCRMYTPSRPLHQKSGESVPASADASFSLGLARWYLGMIERHPVLTKAFTASFIFTVSDVTSQTLTHGSLDYFDGKRTLRMAAYGLLVSGPSLHLWFNFVSRILPKTDLLSTLKKIVLGQISYGPIITCIFFSSNAALQGESGTEILQRLKRDLVPTLLNGLVYWPMCDFITFKFVPVRLQPLISNSFSFVWTVYLTYMGNREKASTVKKLDN